MVFLHSVWGWHQQLNCWCHILQYGCWWLEKRPLHISLDSHDFWKTVVIFYFIFRIIGDDFLVVIQVFKPLVAYICLILTTRYRFCIGWYCWERSKCSLYVVLPMGPVFTLYFNNMQGLSFICVCAGLCRFLFVCVRALACSRSFYGFVWWMFGEWLISK